VVQEESAGWGELSLAPPELLKPS